MLRWACVAAACLGATAIACPTCVGPRLGDSERPVAFAASTTFGIDWLGKDIQRDELREDVGAFVTLRPHLDLEAEAPLVWRWLRYVDDAHATAWGVADARVQLRGAVWRVEEPAASDTASLLGGAQAAVTPLTADPYPAQVGSNAFTPRAGLEYRHADQGWGVSAQLLGGWPIAYSAMLRSGRWGQLTAAADYQALHDLRVQLVVNVKAQEQAFWNGASVPATGFVAGFIGGTVTLRATKWLALTAAVFTPVFCISDGYTHSPVFRLSLDLL
jgi:hypothetical protein